MILTERIKEGLARFIDWYLGRTPTMATWNCMALFPAVVVAQDASTGLVDVVPDDVLHRGTGLSRLPIKHGLPGVTVRVPAGARCLVGFEAGDRQRPYVQLWEEGSVTSVTFDGGTEDVARTGDTAGEICCDPAALALGAACIYYRSGTGVWTLIANTPGGPPIVGFPGTSIVIDSGNTKLHA